MTPHTREGNLSVNDDLQDEGRAWDLKDEFKYAPKRPEGDPWKTLLDPLLEREKKRCDSWNTEIQNLLIFFILFATKAGLFSGLVTAFIIESYKILQPDPNDDIVALLAHIAQRFDNPTSETSALNRPSSTFIASKAAVRVNIFWFISLILSLTVILAGIIAMQWLREHQAYTGQSSKDMIAILNMRVESLEKWHVKDIITTFPLVLAVALVLFFAGIIDFIHVLGNKTLLVAVATVISITLILLVTSTTLPSAQCTFLYIWLGRQEPPSPCPYKSPQSGFFHGVCYYISAFFSQRRSRFFLSIGKWLRNLSQLNAENKHALLYLTDTWTKKTWAEVDLCWLSIREACLFPQELEGYHDFLDRNGIAPLFDITKTFQGVFDGVKLPNDILSAVYHCFHEVSAPFVSRDHPKRKAPTQRDELDPTFEMIRWRNNFLHSLIHSQDIENPTLPSAIEFLPVQDVRKKFHSNIYILHHHNIFTFVDQLTNQYPKELSDHRIELGIRLGCALYKRGHETDHSREHHLPSYLRGEIFDQRRWKTLKNDITVPVFQQYTYALMTFFEGAAHPDIPINISSDRLLAHGDTAEFLEKAAWDTYRVITAHNLSKYPPGDRRKALRVFKDLLEKISSLLMSVNQVNSPKPASPIHLLYFCAIYIRRLNSLRFHAGPEMDQQAIGTLEGAITTARISKTGIIDNDNGCEKTKVLNNWLCGTDRFGSIPRFSPEWWCFLDGKHDEHSKDSEMPAGHRPKRRPTPAGVVYSSAPAFPKPMIPMGGLRIPSKSAMLQPPGSIVATESINSVYSNESYTSTRADSPITNGYSSVMSSPMDEKGQSFEPSPIVPYSVSSMRKNDRSLALLDVPSGLHTDYPPRPPSQQGEASTVPISRDEFKMEIFASSLISRTNPTALEEVSMPHPMRFPEPVHHPNTASSDNPYDSSTQN